MSAQSFDQRICAIEMEPELGAKFESEQLPAMLRIFAGQPVTSFVYVYRTREREMKSPNVVAPESPQKVIDGGTIATLR